MVENSKKLTSKKLQVAPLSSPFTSFYEPELTQHSSEVSQDIEEAQPSTTLEKPYSRINPIIKDYPNIIMALHNSSVYQTMQGILQRQSLLQPNTAVLLRRVPNKELDKEQTKKENSQIRSENTAKLLALIKKLPETKPTVLIVEPNINATGSDQPSPESILLIEQTLKKDPNAIIILVTETPECAKKVLQRFPHHHVYYKTNNPDPFGENNTDKAFNQRCLSNNIMDIIPEIAKRSSDGINPPALPTLTPELLSPRSVSTSEHSPTDLATSSGLSTTMSPVSNDRHTTPTPRSIRLNTKVNQVTPVTPGEQQSTTKKSKFSCLCPWKIGKK